MNMKKVLQVRMREGDWLKVSKLAFDSDVSMCEWVRRRIMDAVVREKKGVDSHVMPIVQNVQGKLRKNQLHIQAYQDLSGTP